MIKEAIITEKAILFNINKSMEQDNNIYNNTRGVWRLGDKCNDADYAFAVHNGIVKKVYRIEYWEQASEYCERLIGNPDVNQFRKQFVGYVSTEMSEKYVGKSVKSYRKKGNISPHIFINC